MLGRDEGEHLPPAELNLKHVEVDISGLDDFRTLLGRELDANLRPAVADINRDHSLGVGFGARLAGGRIQAARRKYYESLTSSVANLSAYVTAAEILTDAIRRVTSRYHDTDMASAAGAARINAELSAAFLHAQKAQLADV
ncbi:MAG TPA: hypothetical protein VF163_09785, partial [Micromonosporaceae bacterium]